MRKKLIGLLTAATMVLNMGVIKAARQENETETLMPVGLSEHKAIELTPEQIEGAVTEPESMGSDGMSIQEAAASFFDYGTDYGYQYLKNMSNSANLCSCYEQLEAMCKSFAASTRNVSATYYSGIGNVYKLSSTDYTFNISSDWAVAVYYTFKLDHPEYYWLSNEILYSGVSSTRTKLIPCIDSDYIEYSTRRSLESAMDASFKVYAENARAKLSISKYAALKQIHDDICLAVDYGYDSGGKPLETAEAHNIQGVLDGDREADAVCESYAKTFELVANAVGLENVIVVGTANGGGHVWNMARFDDGEYYYIDVTWDDRGSYASYTYFAKGTGYFIGTGNNKHYPNESTGTGTDFLYDLPDVPSYNYTVPASTPSPTPTSAPTLTPTPLPTDYGIDVSFTDLNNGKYMVEVNKDIPDGCHLYIAAYDRDERLISVSITQKAGSVSKNEQIKVIKAFVMYDNMMPVTTAKEKIFE